MPSPVAVAVAVVFAAASTAMAAPSGWVPAGGHRDPAVRELAMPAASAPEPAAREQAAPEPAARERAVPEQIGSAPRVRLLPPTPSVAAGDPAGTERSVSPAQWQWPLTPAPGVVRRFQPPALDWLPGHRGVDLATEPGAVVVAPRSGVVTFAATLAGRGVLVVTHPDGTRSTFEPVQATAEVGRRVAAGQPVGIVAEDPGHCPPATCLHWGVRLGTDYLDPLALVLGRRVILLPLS